MLPSGCSSTELSAYFRATISFPAISITKKPPVIRDS
jgi:hypothetical protein